MYGTLASACTPPTGGQNGPGMTGRSDKMGEGIYAPGEWVQHRRGLPQPTQLRERCDSMTIPAMELGDEAPTALYRLYNTKGKLLYIGISGDLKTRFAAHATTKAWWPEVTRKTVEWHPTRAGAAEAELAAIAAERPMHNIVGIRSGSYGFDPGDLRADITAEEIIELATVKMSPQALRLALLELTGIPTRAALDMLDIPRPNRYRAINQREAALGPKRRPSKVA